MRASLTTRLGGITRPELVAGIGVVLIVSGLVLRFLGSTTLLPAVALLRSLSDHTLTLVIESFGLFQIFVGVAMLALVATHVRRRAAVPTDADNRTSQP